MKRVKIVVAYDGTNYCGWQVQPNGLSVQEVLEKHLSDLLCEEIRIAGAGRTDAESMPWEMWLRSIPAHGWRRIGSLLP